MTAGVMLSIGRTYTEQQDEFVRSLIRFVRDDLGLEPYAQKWTDNWPSGSGVANVQEVLGICAGTIIVAFERKLIVKGKEFRDCTQERPLDKQRLPTVWNQVEGAMAYMAGHPLLVIMEHGLNPEGVLDEGPHWSVLWVDLASVDLKAPPVAGVFRHWKQRVLKRQADVANVVADAAPPAAPATPPQPPVDVDKLTFGRVLHSLTIQQIWGLISSAFVVLAGVATAGFYVGRYVK